MIRRLRVENYKSLKRVDVGLGPLQILIGQNASGKSNLIDALRLLQEAMAGDIETAIAQRGGFEVLLFQGKRWGDKFVVQLNYAETVRSRDIFEYSVEVAEQDGRAGLDEERLYLYRNREPPSEIFHARWGRARTLDGRELFNTRDAGVLSLKAVGFLEGVPGVRELRTFIEGMQFLQVDLNKIREPQRDYRVKRLLPDGSNLANVLRTLLTNDPTTFAQIVTDLRSLLALVDAVEVQVERGQVMFMLKERGLPRTLDPLSLSDGTLRLLALVTALHTVPAHGLLCVEEPEHGLHPLLFGPLLDLIRERCSSDSARQALITTHSPDLVDAARPEEVLPIHRDVEGATVLNQLDRRKLKKWLKDFRLGELWRMRQIGGVP